MQTTFDIPENLMFGIQLWALECLSFDGADYRFTDTPRVEAAHRGRVAYSVNDALKRQFGSPGELVEVAKGYALSMELNYLRRVVPSGSTVYSVITHESRTGSSSRIMILVASQNMILPITGSVGKVLEIATPFGELSVDTPGDVAGPRIVERLAMLLFGKRESLIHVCLSNGRKGDHGD